MEPFLLLSVINRTFCTFKVKTYLLAETVVTKDFAIKQTHQKIICEYQHTSLNVHKLY